MQALRPCLSARAQPVSNHAETHISAEQSQARQSPRIPRAHEDQRRSSRACAPPRPRPPQADCQRRKKRPLFQSRSLVRRGALRSAFRGRPGFCAPPISAKSMTTVSASPVLCSPHSAWRALDRRPIPVRASVSRYRGPSAKPSCAIASSAASARPSACSVPESAPNGTSSSTPGASRSTHPSKKLNRPCGK